MNNIAFNLHIGNLLKARYSIFLAIFPIGLMFLSFAPTWLLAEYLSGFFGIQEGAPIKDAENGWLWLSEFLSAMVVLMLLGYITGWLINALLALVIFRWSREKIYAVYLNSDVPDSWLKDSVVATPTAHKQDKLEQWRKTRKQGKLKYILKIGVIGWGSLMYIIMAVLPAFRSSEPLGFTLIWQAALWATAGALFGALTWYFSEKQYLKHSG
jgi:MFS family permease